MAKKPAEKSTFKTIILSLITLFVGILSASYLTTDSFDFGGHYHKLLKNYKNITVVFLLLKLERKGFYTKRAVTLQWRR